MRQIRGLYGITPDNVDNLTAYVELALRGGTRIIQYRNKSADNARRLKEAQALRQLCNQYSACFIVNDDIELCLAVDADGLHIGKTDGDIAAIKSQLDEKLLGVSCYNQLENAMRAQDLGADYVAFGRFFASKTKPDAVQAEIEVIHQAKRQVNLPVVAIGGVTHINAKILLRAGVDAVAVIDGLFNQPDIESSARQFTQLFKEQQKEEE